MQKPAHADNAAPEPLTEDELFQHYRVKEVQSYAVRVELLPRWGPTEQVIYNLIERILLGNGGREACKLTRGRIFGTLAPLGITRKKIARTVQRFVREGCLTRNERGHLAFGPNQLPGTPNLHVPLEVAANQGIPARLRLRCGLIFGRILNAIHCKDPSSWIKVSRMADFLSMDRNQFDPSIDILIQQGFLFSQGRNRWRRVGVESNWREVFSEHLEAFNVESALFRVGNHPIMTNPEDPNWTDRKTERRRLLQERTRLWMVEKQTWLEGYRRRKTLTPPAQIGAIESEGAAQIGAIESRDPAQIGAIESFENDRISNKNQALADDQAAAIKKIESYKEPKSLKEILSESSAADAADARTKNQTSQERTSPMEKHACQSKDACQSKMPVNREKVAASLKEIAAAKKLAALWVDLEDSGRAPWLSKVDSATRVERFSGRWLDGTLNPSEKRLPAIPCGPPEVPAEDYIGAADFL